MAWLMREASPRTETGAGKSASNAKRLPAVGRALGCQSWASCVEGRSSIARESSFQIGTTRSVIM
jgi:hypothetical protein